MKSFLILLCCALSFTLHAQKLSPGETDAGKKTADSLFNKGKDCLLEFILHQDTALHAQAMRHLDSAKVVYENLMKNGTVTTDAWGMTTAMVIDAKLSTIGIYNSLYGKRFRNEIMAETVKERTKKVTYKGVEYKLSKASKTHFENINI